MEHRESSLPLSDCSLEFLHFFHTNWKGQKKYFKKTCRYWKIALALVYSSINSWTKTLSFDPIWYQILSLSFYTLRWDFKLESFLLSTSFSALRPQIRPTFPMMYYGHVTVLISKWSQTEEVQAFPRCTVLRGKKKE